MRNLTEISIVLRKFFIWFAIVSVVYLIGRFFFGIIIETNKTNKPIPIEPPNVRYNILPKPVFTNIIKSTSGMQFTLRNIEGTPPEATNAAKVYSMPKKRPSLLSQEKAKEFAADLGFEDEPVDIVATKYLYIDKQNPLRSLELDTINIHFYYQYDFSQNVDEFQSIYISSEERALNEVKSYLNVNNLFDASIIGGQIVSEYLKYSIENDDFETVTSLSNTQAIRFNYFREDIDGFKVLPPQYTDSFNYVIYSPIPEIPGKLLEISYIFWPIDFTNFGTYPLRSGAQAWQDLIDGYAIVVRTKNSEIQEVVIRDIYLAYYDSNEPQDYLQPIYVFEGDNDFVAYLPAIHPDWLE